MNSHCLAEFSDSWRRAEIIKSFRVFVNCFMDHGTCPFMGPPLVQFMPNVFLIVETPRILGFAIVAGRSREILLSCWTNTLVKTLVNTLVECSRSRVLWPLDNIFNYDSRRRRNMYLRFSHREKCLRLRTESIRDVPQHLNQQKGVEKFRSRKKLQLISHKLRKLRVASAQLKLRKLKTSWMGFFVIVTI